MTSERTRATEACQLAIIAIVDDDQNIALEQVTAMLANMIKSMDGISLADVMSRIEYHLNEYNKLDN